MPSLRFAFAPWWRRRATSPLYWESCGGLAADAADWQRADARDLGWAWQELDCFEFVAPRVSLSWQMQNDPRSLRSALMPGVADILHTSVAAIACRNACLLNGLHSTSPIPESRHCCLVDILSNVIIPIIKGHLSQILSLRISIEASNPFFNGINISMKTKS